MEDTNIIDLYFARSETAIRETENKYGAYLSTIATNILHRTDDAREVVNDAYLAAWNSIPPQRPRVLKHYLARIARNLAFKRYAYLHAAKRCPQTEVLLSELAECIPDGQRRPDEIVEDKELSASINRFLGTLRKCDCALFVARYFYAQSIEALAAKDGSTPRQIKYRLQKTRHALKNHLRKEGLV